MRSPILQMRLQLCSTPRGTMLSPTSPPQELALFEYTSSRFTRCDFQIINLLHRCSLQVTSSPIEVMTSQGTDTQALDKTFTSNMYLTVSSSIIGP